MVWVFSAVRADRIINLKYLCRLAVLQMLQDSEIELTSVRASIAESTLSGAL